MLKDPQRRLRMPVSMMAAVLAALAVTGCALPPSDPVARQTYLEAGDPLEPLNRYIYNVNEGADILVLRPAAHTYREVVPDPARRSVGNFLRNLYSPLILANQLLQGDWQGADATLQRFVMNSTAGVGGLFDVAAAWEGLPYESEDFGQTLAVWGVPDGPYLVLPLLGPSNLRDATGLVVDSLADPIDIYARNSGAGWVTMARSGGYGLDTRAQLIEAIDDVRRNSLDPYAAFRSLYRQRRAVEIRDGAAAPDGQASSAEFPEFPDYDDLPETAP